MLERRILRWQRATDRYVAALVSADEMLIGRNGPRLYPLAENSDVINRFGSACKSSLFCRIWGPDQSDTITAICAESITGPSILQTNAMWSAGDVSAHVHLDPDLPTFFHQP